MRESLNRKLVEAGLGISRTKEDSHWKLTRHSIEFMIVEFVFVERINWSVSIAT